jgi:hypothetical protein
VLGLGGGIFTRFERAGHKRDLTNKFPTRASLHVPTYTDCTATGCGFDPFTQSGKNPACTTCDGLGRTLAWSVAYVMCRVSWVDRIRIGVEFWKGVAVGETGEIIIGAMLRDEALFRQVMESQDAYILVNRWRVRPFGLVTNRVEGETSLDARCNIVKQ